MRGSAPERDGDSLPRPEELTAPASPAAARRRVQVGPLAVVLSSQDPVVLRAVADWPGVPPGEPPPIDLEIEILASDRATFLATRPGERARVTTWMSGDRFAAATHDAALALEPSGRGRALLAPRHQEDMARSIQNAVRIAVAWRLAATGRGLLVHASAVENDGEAVVFLGPSGSGKSTVARLSLPRPVLADDVVILTSREGGGALAWPSPLWAEPALAGSSGDGSPRRVAALLRLRQAERHGVEGLSWAAAAAVVAAHAPFIQDFEALDAGALAGSLTRGLHAATLSFAKDGGFWTAIVAPEPTRAPTRSSP